MIVDSLITLFFGKILTLLREAKKSLPVTRFNPQPDIQTTVQQSGRGLNPCLIAKIVGRRLLITREIPMNFSPLLEDLSYETGVFNPCRTPGTIDQLSKRSTNSQNKQENFLNQSSTINIINSLIPNLKSKI
ncbi:MAG: hypothetical protein EAZ78_22300 [Oscillatoriales cyanobacterium]|nr:MAG: hypothetical protein EA000_19295 [Oscillatoriales cyanobacterium]TAD94718.1 MAG: hypothetical protein EAZ98_18270 [Oscillatoriales cyanobacterium]TAE05876.1 MAG: hypothetical protein EAZ96_04050 [Oscillatoriales cyanobacterium]TAE99350.1 MAG: hypothetical protein EAZ78_22300 [Oscillatoriales cyanobacterium]TAF69848.1 MAG: hypothetical protein EAZ59_07015 [Oscillatoriales cyanobacterium]